MLNKVAARTCLTNGIVCAAFGPRCQCFCGRRCDWRSRCGDRLWLGRWCANDGFGLRFYFCFSFYFCFRRSFVGRYIRLDLGFNRDLSRFDVNFRSRLYDCRKLVCYRLYRFEAPELKRCFLLPLPWILLAELWVACRSRSPLHSSPTQAVGP